MLYWDRTVQRYRDAAGRFVDQRSIRDAMGQLVAATKREASALARQLAAKEIGLGQWQLGMRDLLKAAHAIAGGVGYGGRDQLTEEALNAIGLQTMKQFAYLNRFGDAIERGQVSVLQVNFRAQLYGNALRGTYYEGEKKTRIEAGYKTCLRVLTARESCQGCLEWADAGYVEIEEQPEIGTLECGAGCKCYLVYKK